MDEIGMKFDLFVYILLVWGLLQCNQLQKVRFFFEEMIGEGIVFDEVLCVSVLKKYYEFGCVDEVVELQGYLMKYQFLISDKNNVFLDM